jgi:hypothetical protein
LPRTQLTKNSYARLPPAPACAKRGEAEPASLAMRLYTQLMIAASNVT